MTKGQQASGDEMITSTLDEVHRALDVGKGKVASVDASRDGRGHEGFTDGGRKLRNRHLE
jgi:hypothetical protein